MDVRIYVGAHRTATQHLASVLLENKAALDAENTFYIHDNTQALKLMSDATAAISEAGDAETIQDKLLNQLTQNRNVDRILLINPHIMGRVSKPFGAEFFYPRARGLAKQLQTLFTGHSLRLFTAIRNPATFIPSCYAEAILNATFSDFKTFLGDIDLGKLTWSSYLHRIQGRGQPISLTTWRYEDYPFIWRDVAQAFTGLSNTQDFPNNTNAVNNGLNLKGAMLLNSYAEKFPDQTRAQLENTQKAFMERFPSNQNTQTPEWSPEIIKFLTENYEDDWYYITRMENIKAIQQRVFT